MTGVTYDYTLPEGVMRPTLICPAILSYFLYFVSHVMFFKYSGGVPIIPIKSFLI